VFVFAYLDAQGAVATKYLDCIPFLNAVESKDWCFVETVFRGFQKAGFFLGFHEILWWSDTGPNHFRVSNTLYFFRLFQMEHKIKMRIFFFAPYHGHSKCDGHIGAIARKLAKQAGKLAKSALIWDKAFVEKCIAELRNTFLTKHLITRELPRVQTLAGIKQYLCFEFDDAKVDSVDCRVVCGVPSQTLYFQRVAEGEVMEVADESNDELESQDLSLMNEVGIH
jgi:hypothetical protein